MGEYINIYGLLFAKTADGKLAFTGQIWDEALQKFQSDINAKTPQLGEDGKLPVNLLPESFQNATSSEVVTSLPETGEANKIYLVKREGSDPVVYDPSMWIDGAWASFGGSGGGSVTWDDILNKPTIANTYQLPDDFQFGTPVSDEVHAAIMAAKLIIVPQAYIGTPACAGTILSFNRASNGILYFNAPYVADSFIRITYTEATKILTAPASSYYIDYSAVHTAPQTLSTAQKTQARTNIGAASQADVDEINQILFTQYTALTMSRTPASFEKGVETAVTLNWSTKFNNQEVTPDSIEVKKGATVLTTDKTLKTIGDNISGTQAYSMTAVIKGITKTASVTVNAYYPMYFGASAKDALTSADVLALTKQPIKSSPAGNVTVEVGANEYLWLCVPSTMTINSVKSGGFDVPMAAPVTVAVDGKGDYKCYRSAGPFAEGTFNGVIA